MTKKLNMTKKLSRAREALRPIVLAPKQAASVLSSLSPQQTVLLNSAFGNALTHAKPAPKSAPKPAPKPAPPTETEAATAIARAWLGKAGFHEDPTHESPERIEIQGSGWEDSTHEHYVDVRVYIPAIDIEHVIEGTHPDGITAEPS